MPCDNEAFHRNPRAKWAAGIAAIILVFLAVFLPVYFLVIVKEPELCWIWRDGDNCKDPCQAYQDNCYDCLVAGCLYCAGENVCMSRPPYSDTQDFWAALNGASQPFGDSNNGNMCTTQEEWIENDVFANRCPPVYNDPSYSKMQKQYQLMRVEQVWKQNITGYGVTVRINEPKVDPHHAEFQDVVRSDTSSSSSTMVTKFDYAESCQEYPATIVDPNATTLDYDTVHGTSIMSLVGANADNDQCALGIAPGATMSACSFGALASEDDMADMLESRTEYVDISSNSWGMNVCSYACRPMCIVGALWPTECSYNEMTPRIQDVLRNGVTHGRGGKGIVYVFAAGNADKFDVNTNMLSFVSSRYTISVGAVNKRGNYLDFSNTGASLTITAPAEGLAVAKPGGGCHSFGVGTSFATAMVSGVLALVLEAAPWLSWRDVQGILAHSAKGGVQGPDPYGNQARLWPTNGAGLQHSYQFGFGVIDAAAAVELARTWKNYGSEVERPISSGPIDLPIPDNKEQPATSEIMVDKSADFSIESVVVALDLAHEARGHLEIILTSPSGMESILMPGGRNENRQYPTGDHVWELTTLRHWDERPVGRWNLTLIDLKQGGEGECADEPWAYGRLNETSGKVADPSYDCKMVQSKRFCREGQVLNATVVATLTDASRGTTPVESCCACGGGTNVTHLNLLRSWTLHLYGHDYVEDMRKK